MSWTGRRSLAAVLVAGVLAGCSGEVPDGFADRVGAVRTAAEAGDVAAARAALDELISEVRAAVEAGELDEDRGQAILAAAAVVGDELGDAPVPAPSPEPVDEEPAEVEVEVEDDGKDDDKGEGNGKGNGKGKGKDEKD